jgi:hypothetical protein
MNIKTLNLVKNLQYAKRNGNLKHEQKAYEILLNHCNKYKLDFNETYYNGIEELKKSVAAIMNSII